jgi:protein-tyrosine phosphatase
MPWRKTRGGADRLDRGLRRLCGIADCLTSRPGWTNNDSEMSTCVIPAQRSEDQTRAVEQAVAALDEGKLVAFATETVYGIAARADRPEAMRRLRQIKARPDAPFSVHIGSRDQAQRYVKPIPLRAWWLMRKAWPGPVTILLPTGGAFPDASLEGPALYDELTHDGYIGLRCPDQPVAIHMLRRCEGPVVAPSANPAGEPSPHTPRDVLDALDGQIDLLLDSGPARFGKDSSIVRFRGNQWELLREGVYDRRMLESLMRRKIAFVCTGNTCRSPIAAGLARMLLAERLGCEPDRLEACGVEIHSAGLFASAGATASPEAVTAAERRGTKISDHKSRLLSADLLQSCDTVYGMTALHVEDIRRQLGGAETTVLPLDPDEDVPDPIGGGPAVYEKTAEHIENALRRKLDEGTL